MAREAGKVSIVSSHDFETTPQPGDLGNLLRESYVCQRPDFVKMATTANTSAEFNRLLAFTSSLSGRHIITVAMGRFGPLSRIALPAAGSRLTYAAQSQKTAIPGQMEYTETRALLDRFYPAPQH